MRLAVLPLLPVIVAGCGAQAPQHGSAPPAGVSSVQRPPSPADAARNQWYSTVKHSTAPAPAPVLSEAELRRALVEGAAAVDARVVRMDYLPVLGGTADVVVLPDEPLAFANAAAVKITTLMGPLARHNRPFLVTIVGSAQKPLVVLGWGPDPRRQIIAEGVAWQAPGIHSGLIWGEPVTQGTDCYLTTRNRGFVTTSFTGVDQVSCGFEPVISESIPRTR